MKDNRQLEIWNLAHQITLMLCAVTAKVPREELFGLTSRLRRKLTTLILKVDEVGHLPNAKCGLEVNENAHER